MLRGNKGGMMDRIYLEKVDKNKLKQEIAKDFGIPVERIDDKFLEFIEKFIESKSFSDEYFKKKIIDISPPALPGTMELLVCIHKTYYFINVKKTTWTTIGLLLDLFVTKGVASAFLSSLGVIGRSIAKLSLKNGEVCCYYQALSLKKEGVEKFTGDQLFYRIGNKKCSNPEFNCIYKKQDLCSINVKDLQQVIGNLERKSVISKTEDGKWRVEL